MTWKELCAIIAFGLVLRLVVTISEYDPQDCSCTDRLCDSIILTDGSIHKVDYTMHSNFLGIVKVKTQTLNGTQFCNI